MASQHDSALAADDRLIWEVMDSAADSIVVVDDQGRIILANRQTEELFGYLRHELLGKPVETLLPEGMAQRHRAHRTRYRAEPRTRAMGTGPTLRGRRADGREFPVEISLSPLKLGGELHVVASVSDLTERIAAEACMREVLSVLDQVQEAVFFVDRTTGRFTRVNQAAMDQVGYTTDELTAMGLLHLMPELTDAELGKLLATIESGEAPCRSVTTTFRHKSGNDLPVELVLQSPIAAPGGEDPPFVAVARDLRQRVNAEQFAVIEERDHMARDLQEIVIQRIFTAGLALNAAMERVHETDVSERLGAVVDELDATIRELRRAVFALRSS